MRIAVAADHAGFPLKQSVADALRKAGHDVVDLGAKEFNAGDDYPDYVLPLAKAVASGQVTRGIAVCGSGVGATVAANKVRGEGGVIMDMFSARQGVEDDDMNVICLALGSSALPWPGSWLRPFLPPVTAAPNATPGGLPKSLRRNSRAARVSICRRQSWRAKAFAEAILFVCAIGYQADLLIMPSSGLKDAKQDVPARCLIVSVVIVIACIALQKHVPGQEILTPSSNSANGEGQHDDDEHHNYGPPADEPRKTLFQWSYGTSFSGGPELGKPLVADRPDFTQSPVTVGARAAVSKADIPTPSADMETRNQICIPFRNRCFATAYSPSGSSFASNRTSSPNGI